MSDPLDETSSLSRRLVKLEMRLKVVETVCSALIGLALRHERDDELPIALDWVKRRFEYSVVRTNMTDDEIAALKLEAEELTNQFIDNVELFRRMSKT